MTNEISHEIRKLAWEWVSRIQSQESTDQDMRDLAEWLKEDPSHLRAYTEYQEIMWDLDELAELPEGFALHKPEIKVAHTSSTGFIENVADKLSWLFRPQTGWALASVMLIATLTIYLRHPDEAIHRLDYQTGVGEIRSLTLADGSMVTVGADSRIESEISNADRLVRLLNGEAFFEVSKMEGVPFRVEVANTIVRVVGTKFNINQSSNRIKVSVVEGVVRVASTGQDTSRDQQPEHAVELRGGQQVALSRSGDFGAITSIQVLGEKSWRNGWLTYKSEPLADVISDANRYFRGGHIDLGDPRLAEMPITLSIRTENIRVLPEMLSASAKVVLVDGPNGHITLNPSENGEP